MTKKSYRAIPISEKKIKQKLLTRGDRPSQKFFIMITVYSAFGHEIFACASSIMLNTQVEVASKKEVSVEAEIEKYMNAAFLKAFGVSIKIVPEGEAPIGRDIVSELKAGTLPDGFWYQVAGTHLPIAKSSRKYPLLEDGKKNVMIVPAKWLTDGQCGLNAAQQSLSHEVLAGIFAEDTRYVFGQHYDRFNDMETVLQLQQWMEERNFELYIPGQLENKDVLGIRKVPHMEYFNMYANLNAIVGIAGTHTWIGLFCFPEIPQIILYNKNGVEHWSAIAESFQRKGYRIFAIGYNENTDMQKLNKEIAETYKKL